MPVLESTPLYRSKEVDLLSAFITDDIRTTVPALIVHGYKSIGKTYTLDSFFNSRLSTGVKKTIIRCDECVTKRVLLQRCLKRIREDSGIPKSKYSENVSYRGGEVTNFGGVCENFENFIIAMEQFIDETGYNEPHVLVLDRIDQCMEIADDLYTAFNRLHEQSTVKFLTTVLVISGDLPKEIVTSGVPQVFFKAYESEQVLDILQSQQLCQFNANLRIPVNVQVDFWNQYTKIIVDLFFSYTGSNMNVLIDICYELWEHFTKPIESGRYQPQDFLKIYREIRTSILDDNVFSQSQVEPYNETESNKTNSSSSFDLPVHSQFILMACYLASLIEPKNDLQMFSKLKTLRAEKSNKKSSPSKSSSKRQQMTRQNIDTRLLTPGTFELERMLSILTVIYRNESSSLSASIERLHMIEEENDNWDKELATFTLNADIDVNSQLATLASLGLVQRTSSDVLSSQARWKCNMSWSTAESIAKELNFPLKTYLED